MEAQDWLSRQPDLIEGNCKCRMTKKACLERQERHAHKAIIGQGNGAHEVTRHYFTICTGNAKEGPCPHYVPKGRDAKNSHRSFDMKHRINADALEAMHKKNRHNRATRGVVTARRNG